MIYFTISGWHHRINGKARHRCCGLYVLCPLLLQDSRVVETRVHSDNFCRNVRRGTKKIRQKLEAAWDQWDSGRISTGLFLRVWGAVYAAWSNDWLSMDWSYSWMMWLELWLWFVLHAHVQWPYAYLLHFYDIIWYGIRMLWNAFSMLCYATRYSKMISYGMVCYALLWDLSKRSFLHKRVPFILHFFSIKTHFL